MAEFNINSVKSPTLKQNNKTFAGRIGLSTINNKAAVILCPADFEITLGIQREDIGRPGFVNGKGNGRSVQTTGNYGIIVRAKIFVSRGAYIPQRNAILALLQGNKAFNLQLLTTQENQTIPMLNGSNNNFFYGFATDISFSDTFNGRVFADGSDSIAFTFYEVPEVTKPQKKRSIFAALDKAVNFLDQIQTNIGYATLALQGINTTLIETAKSVSNYASGVSSFVQEVNQLKNSVGSLVKSPSVLAENYVNAIKSFQGLFSSGDAAVQKQYYTPLKSLVEYNKDTPVNRAKIVQPDGSLLNVYDNIEKNIVLGKSTVFIRAVALLTLCNNYENYTFTNSEEAFEAWQNILTLFNYFASETKFDGIPAEANVSSNFTNSVFEPEAFEATRDYVYQTLEAIRAFIFNDKGLTTKSIIEPSNIYEIVAKYYGSLDKIDDFVELNKFSSYSEVIENGYQVKFN